MVSSEWRMGGAERTVRHSPISVPIAPCLLSKRLKTLKRQWLAIGWSWHGFGIDATFTADVASTARLPFHPSGPAEDRP
jgi:hypothetical protein